MRVAAWNINLRLRSRPSAFGRHRPSPSRQIAKFPAPTLPPGHTRWFTIRQTARPRGMSMKGQIGGTNMTGAGPLHNGARDCGRTSFGPSFRSAPPYFASRHCHSIQQRTRQLREPKSISTRSLWLCQGRVSITLLTAPRVRPTKTCGTRRRAFMLCYASNSKRNPPVCPSRSIPCAGPGSRSVPNRPPVAVPKTKSRPGFHRHKFSAGALPTEYI